MTVYIGDLTEKVDTLQAAVDALDLQAATPAEMEAVTRSAQELAGLASERLATLDATLASEEIGGLAELVSGAEAEASAVTLTATVADYEQAIILFAVHSYAARLAVNLQEAAKLR